MAYEISDEAGGLYSIKWENNENGPDSRMIEEDHPFCSIIVSEARDDPDATVTRIV